LQASSPDFADRVANGKFGQIDANSEASRLEFFLEQRYMMVSVQMRIRQKEIVAEQPINQRERSETTITHAATGRGFRPHLIPGIGASFCVAFIESTRILNRTHVF
jgi:hypothetical protein